MQEKKLPIFPKAENVSLKILSIYQQRRKTIMPVNTLNNEKTEAIKASLVVLLNQLENRKQRIIPKKAYIYIDDKIAPYIPRDEIEFLNIGISTLSNLNKQFESVDDLNSVKKLRQAELLFSKSTGLKDFTFPDYKSWINPTFLIYVEIEIQLDGFDRKAIDLLHRGYKSAGEEASWVVFNLRNLNQWFFKEKRIDYEDYRSKTLDLINQCRPELAQHRGYKKLLGNLILLILTLGTAFIVNKTINGHFLFFQKTDSAKQLDELSQILAGEKHLLP